MSGSASDKSAERELARKILSVDDQAPSLVFRQVAEGSTKELNLLVGTTVATLRDAIRSANYWVWFSGRNPSGAADKATRYLGAVTATADEYRRVVSIDVADDRVTNARVATVGMGVRFVQPTNFYQTRDTLVLFFGGGVTWERYNYNTRPPATWRLANMLSSISDPEVVAGVDQPVQLLAPEEFLTRSNRITGDTASVRDFNGLRVAIEMEKRARQFDAASLDEDLRVLPASLQTTFVRLAVAAVKRDVAARRFLRPPLGETTLGQLAATVLRPGFRIVSARPRGGAVGTQTAVPAEATIEIKAVWADSSRRDDEARFEFAQDGQGHLLVAFEGFR